MKSPQNRRWVTRRSAGVSLVLIAAVVLSFLWYIGVLDSNFRVVTPGRFYRSGQMNAQELGETIREYKIRTVINLKGSSKKDWYFAEKQAAEAGRVRYVDVDLNPWKLPPPKELATLVQTYQNGPYPILVHCQAGSDRAGLASTLYRILIERAPLETAWKEQLAWRYGHFSFGKARAMDKFFELYGQSGKGKDLARWIRENYPEDYKTVILP
jgi:protein tyrosine/serine phosphatase